MPQRPLPRLQPKSGLPDFGRLQDRPKSETSDFGWRDRERAFTKNRARTPSPHPSPASGRGSTPRVPRRQRPTATRVLLTSLLRRRLLALEVAEAWTIGLLVEELLHAL